MIGRSPLVLISFCLWGSLCLASEKPVSLYDGLKLSELEQLEFDRPDDPQLKLELGRHYWCRKERGLAVEHWRWLYSQSQDSLTETADGLLKRASKDSQSLTQELCQAYPQNEL